MKYAKPSIGKAQSMENIGDWVQVFAIENLYNHMNIPEEDIVPIMMSELSTYDGETVVLPINFPMFGIYNLSPQIIPVFLGISIIDNCVNAGLGLEKYQPIGCRDYHSLVELRKSGLDAYYGGCLSICFDRRVPSKNQNKIFIADVSERIYNNIPVEIRKKATLSKQVFWGNECGGRDLASKIYAQYRDEASVVITSKIHCAQPCIAMGIPVIFICEQDSYRFDLLRPFIPVYTLNKMDEIDWNPQLVEMEEHKRNMLRNASKRVKDTFDKYYDVSIVNDTYWINSQRQSGKIDTVWAFDEYLEEHYKEGETFEYAFWGYTQFAESAYKLISSKYPNAKLTHLFDKKEGLVFHGIKSTRLEDMKDYSGAIFVTVCAVTPFAKETFEQYNVKKHVVCHNGYHLVDGVEKDY